MVLRDVLPYSAAVAAGTLYFYMAIVIVSLLADSHELSYFSVSARVIQVLIVIPGLAVGAAFPIFSRAARDDRARLAYALGRVFEVSLLRGVLVALCLAIGSSVAIKVIGGAQFAPAAAVLAIQGVGLGADFCGAVWSNGLLSLGRYREILVINLLALLLGALLIALLVSVDGAGGSAMATAAGEIVLAVSSGCVLARSRPLARASPAHRARSRGGHRARGRFQLPGAPGTYKRCSGGCSLCCGSIGAGRPFPGAARPGPPPYEPADLTESPRRP